MSKGMMPAVTTKFTGVDNLGPEALLMGAVGWVSGVSLAFPKENQKIYDLVQENRIAEAREIYRWFRPVLNLDVSTYLVQQIKLAEVIELGSTE
jgi:4-hydroxy-tetrahydrodipicolinate synthase